MKKLVIISGVTGCIGQELLRRYILEKDTLIYGISRKGVSLDEFRVLPDHNMIISVDLEDAHSIKNFIKKIPIDRYESITYFHLVGEFKTEITKDLHVSVENDIDGDGIDDTVYNLVAKAYIEMVMALVTVSKTLRSRFKVVSFGSLADAHDIKCFS